MSIHVRSSIYSACYRVNQFEQYLSNYALSMPEQLRTNKI